MTGLDNRADKWSWVAAKDGTFSVASSRALLNRYAIPFYPLVWVKLVPKKVNIFEW
ncbi:hypothetical protein HanXRQr2_Chr06g0249581 [Helianthus annuus]|uniref:Reverse transcriptase zinc-binding domain-containing protein n=1 Tax=Helianthus annuus TaxID=4232 RepID=A0A9K3IRS3_HELAN|nr:hypothetical protein HanXRQr2_Chr06g0249581 [Helianthus annuus]